MKSLIALCASLLVLVACGGGGNAPQGASPTSAQVSLNVLPTSQPIAGIAPLSAQRLATSDLTLVAIGKNVTVQCVEVEETGDAANTGVVAGMALLDKNSIEIGNVTRAGKTRSCIGEPFVIEAGTSQTITVSMAMSSNYALMQSQAHRTIGLKIVGVKADAPLTGTLPVSGTEHAVSVASVVASAYSYIGVDPIDVMESVLIPVNVGTFGEGNVQIMAFGLTAPVIGPLTKREFSLTVSALGCQVADVTMFGYTDFGLAQPIS
ncbi:hypothetical protein KW797_03405, partial [Candidatus Parcubacteria bacterium]|nr:hypothetical protein [Candidatus Parcubacteria bacterium]